jgi:carotenoid cleavage dioxygenase-like enzyme
LIETAMRATAGTLFSFLAKDRSVEKLFPWNPDDDCRAYVIERETGSIRGSWLIPPLFMFHVINAFEDDTENIIVDLCAYQDPGIVRSFDLAGLRSGNAETPPIPSIQRLTLRGGCVAAEVEELCVDALEFPQINYAAFNGRPYRYVYGIGVSRDAPDGFYNAIVKVCVETGERTEWHEHGIYPGEPVFVAGPGAAQEDDGLLLSVALDGNAGKSTLLMLDAKTLHPVARAQCPHLIPHGFHGAYWAS